MSRALLILANDEVRKRALQWVAAAPIGTRVEFKAPKRTLDQNSLMWALLTDVSRQAVHFGVKYSPDDWKLIFMAALSREMRTAINLDGDGIVPLTRSSDLSVEEMGDLITLILAWGDQHGIAFHSDQRLPDQISAPAIKRLSHHKPEDEAA